MAAKVWEHDAAPHSVMFSHLLRAGTRRRFLAQAGLAGVLMTVSDAFAESSSPLPPPTTPQARSARVFYASHSLMWYVPKILPELAKAAGVDNQIVGVQAIGASRTLQHWEKGEPNQAKEALKTGNVDVFVMSPIQFPDEGIENFVKLGLEYNPAMRFLVQFSWGGGDRDNQDFSKASWDKPDWNKTPEQLAKLSERNIAAGRAQIEALNAKYGKGRTLISVVPTSEALVTLRTKIYRKELPGLASQSELFVDAAHPSPPLEMLNAYLHFAVLYGRSPVGLPLPEKLKAAHRKEWDEKLNRVLQEIAWQTAIADPSTGVPPAAKRQ